MKDIWDDMFENMENMFGNIGDIQKRFETMLKNFSDPNVKTYGYTMYKGPDGVPHVHEFGSDMPASVQPAGVREPLTDVCVDGDIVRVTVELPGVSKEDIQLNGSENSMIVSVDTESRKFEKTVAMPCKVEPDSAKAEYNNGILEVTMNVLAQEQKSKRIEIN